MTTLEDDDGSEDVNDFLKRIKELGDRRDREDEERNRRLEEQIVQGRKERQARREERARYLSPTKNSNSSEAGNDARENAREARATLYDPPKTSAPAQILGQPAPMESDAPSITNSDITPEESDEGYSTAPHSMPPSKPRVLSNASLPDDSAIARRGTLSWQDQPSSRAPARPTKPPISWPSPALDNARPPHSSDPPRSGQTDVLRSRSQISNTLSSKDPSWFKQTLDQGRASPAYQKRQDEGIPRLGSSKAAVNLPGMAGKNMDAPVSSAPTSRDLDSIATTAYVAPFADHPTPTTKSEVDPRTSRESLPSVDHTSYGGPEKLLSTAHRQMSPEQPHRPLSPTKGLGGFVQSAMMKRSDSSAKRWSAQPQHRLKRGDSIVSNRSGTEASRVSPSSVVPSGAKYSRDNTPVSSSSRPSSSHANTSVIIPPKEDNVAEPSGPHKSSRPSTPLNSAPAMLDIQSEKKVDVAARDAKRSSIMTPPTSPSKRSSPQKSSWLENAISMPESPKVFLPPTAPPQPAWMAEITKAKQRGSVDLSASSPHKTIAPTGLLRSPAIGSLSTTPTIGGLQANFSAGGTTTPKSNGLNIGKPSELRERPTTTVDRAHPTLSGPSRFTSSARQNPTFADCAPSSSALDTDQDLLKSPGSAGATKLTSQSSKPPTKPKPSLPPEKELSLNVKPPLNAEKSKDQDDLEFKNAFSKLKRTQTQNYKAPDELKESIMRGKSGLAVTGGPRKSERKDDFRDSILSKKKTMAPPLASTRITSAAQDNAVNTTPEAIRKRVDLAKSSDRTESMSGISRKENDDRSRSFLENSDKLQRPESIGLLKESSPRATLPTSTNPGLGGNFTSALSDILQRGPSPGADTSEGIPPMTERMTISTLPNKLSTSEEHGDSGPQLKHATKARARGPKRRPPTSNRTDTNEAQPQSQSKVAGGEVSRVYAPVLSAESSSPRTQSRSTNDPRLSSRPSETISSIKSRDRKSLQPVSPRKPSTSVNQHTKPSQAAASESSGKAGSRIVSAPKVGSISGPLHDNQKRKPSDQVHRIAKPPIVKAHHSNVPAGSPLSDSSPNSRLPDPVPKPSPKLGQKPSSIRKSLATNVTPETKRQRPSICDFYTEVFDEVPSPRKDASFNAQAAIDSRSLRHSFPKIKTLRKQIVEILENCRSVPVPSHLEHVLFEESIYVCTHIFGTQSGQRMTEVYLWRGDEASPSLAEEAQLYAKKVAKENNGKLIHLSQGSETSSFFQALGGIVITRKGAASVMGLPSGSAARYMLCARQHLGQIAFDEVDFEPSNLCSAFSSLVFAASDKLYLWRGKGACAEELGCARLIGMDLGSGEIEEVDEGNESEDFWSTFSIADAPNRVSQHWPMRSSCEQYSTRLFSIETELSRPKSASGIMQWGRRGSSPSKEGFSPMACQIKEIVPFSQTDVLKDGTYVLDTFFEVFVIQPVQSLSPPPHRRSTRSASFRAGLLFSQEYSIGIASLEDRPFVPPTSVVFLTREDGGESELPSALTWAFRKWDKRKGAWCKILGLAEALEAAGASRDTS